MQLLRGYYYTSLDVCRAYNLLWVDKADKWKTAFQTRYGLYESLVMPFRLTKALADFQYFINNAL